MLKTMWSGNTKLETAHSLLESVLKSEFPSWCDMIIYYDYTC